MGKLGGGENYRPTPPLLLPRTEQATFQSHILQNKCLLPHKTLESLKEEISYVRLEVSLLRLFPR